jgi:putative glycosyltransferase (TIGR04372 family)
LFFQILLHVYRWLFYENWRKSYSFIYPNHKWHDKYSCFLATYVYWLFKPLAFFLINKKILFSINNLPNAVGHIYPEVDYLLRVKKTQTTIKDKTIFYIYPKNPVLTGFVNAVGYTTEIKFIISGLLHILIWPLLMRFPELTISTAHGPDKYSLDDGKRFIKFVYPNHRSHEYTMRTRHKRYFALRAKTLDYFPLKIVSPLPIKLTQMIDSDKYFVIQIKTESINGTWQPCDPSTYHDAIKEVISLGYKVVFAGREKMPESFKKLGLINYSESKNATAANDFYLVLNSCGVIASSSGFSYIPDVLDIPLLTINNFEISVAYPGRKTIHVPSLLTKEGIPMKFKEQIAFHLKGQLTSEVVNDKSIFCEDASAEDVLFAFRELYIIIKTGEVSLSTKAQLFFRNYFPLDLTFYALSDISDHFIKKHEDRY